MHFVNDFYFYRHLCRNSQEQVEAIHDSNSVVERVPKIFSSTVMGEMIQPPPHAVPVCQAVILAQATKTEAGARPVAVMPMVRRVSPSKGPRLNMLKINKAKEQKRLRNPDIEKRM